MGFACRKYLKEVVPGDKGGVGGMKPGEGKSQPEEVLWTHRQWGADSTEAI